MDTHQANHTASHDSFDTRDQGVDYRNQPQVLPVRPPFADLHQQRNPSSTQVEEAEEDQGPKQGKSPDVANRVQAPFGVLGRQVERGEWRRRVARRSAVPPNQSAAVSAPVLQSILFKHDGPLYVRRKSHYRGARRALHLWDCVVCQR
jgi:hypothetical protein